MSLQVWLPLNGDLHNQGLNKFNVNSTAFSVNNFGKIGQCIKTTTDGAIDLGFNGNWINTGSISFGGWFKFIQSEIASAISGKTYTSSATAATGNLIGNNSYGGISLQWNSNNIYSDGSFSSISVQSYLRTNTNGARATTAFTIPFDTWTHIFLTYDKDNNLLGLWINGELKYTYNQLAFTDARSYNLFINLSSIAGGNGPGSYIPFYCNDIRVYDHCLSNKEIEEISKGLVIHYKLNQGNFNLLSKYVVPGQASPGSIATGGRTIFNGNYSIIIPASENADTYFRLFLKQQLIENEIYTISCYVSGLKQGTYYRFPLFAQGNTSMGVLLLDHNGLCSLTFTMNNSAQTAITTPEGDTVYICFMDDSARSLATGQGQIILSGFKLEKGNQVTSGVQSDLITKIYDSSGYNNNGTIIGSLENITLSPKYNCAIKFDGSSFAIEVLKNKWMAQHATEMTINIWVKNSSWNNGANMKFFSCTESGGFNCEAGNSGYVRFPIHVYTNAEQTTYAYKYDSKEIQASALTVNNWNMITFVYNSAGTKTYINGQLHHTYTNISYGIHFNTNAKLFLGCEANTANPTSPYYNGQMSDFKLYYTALTEKQIKELYKDSLIVNGTNIVPRDLE